VDGEYNLYQHDTNLTK
nr:sialidase L, SL {fragment T15-1} [Macrobdella decora=leeches, Peptide Partial, 16 aa] [Macrobdella decora]